MEAKAEEADSEEGALGEGAGRSNDTAASTTSSLKIGGRRRSVATGAP